MQHIKASEYLYVSDICLGILYIKFVYILLSQLNYGSLLKLVEKAIYIRIFPTKYDGKKRCTRFVRGNKALFPLAGLVLFIYSVLGSCCKIIFGIYKRFDDEGSAVKEYTTI